MLGVNTFQYMSHFHHVPACPIKFNLLLYAAAFQNSSSGLRAMESKTSWRTSGSATWRQEPGGGSGPGGWFHQWKCKAFRSTVLSVPSGTDLPTKDVEAPNLKSENKVCRAAGHNGQTSDPWLTTSWVKIVEARAYWWTSWWLHDSFDLN